MSDHVEVKCPCCATELVVDSASGEILSETRPEPDHEATFDSAMDKVQSGEQRRHDAFTKAFDRTKNLDDLLSKKFDEAKKKAEKDTSKPKNPLDWD
jgi:hypothetical protein